MKEENSNKDKKNNLISRLKEFIHKNTLVLTTFLIITIISSGCFLIINGYIQYTKVTRETYMVAGMHSLEDGNYHKAQSFFLKAATLKVPEAFPYLAWINVKSGNFSKALEYCRECAKYKNVYGASEIMGYLALLGYGKAQGAGSALFYFDEAMKSYSPEYLKNHNPLLYMYEYSMNLCLNKHDYVRMVSEAQKQGSSLAYLYRGDIEFLGEDHDLSPNSAAKSWEDAKNNGVLVAQSRLAALLWHGYGKRRDFKGAMKLFEDAAKKHEPVANYSLGLIRFRQGKTSSYAEGMRYMKNAAKMNYGPALTAVGVTAICQSDDPNEISSAVADIFKQAYDCGDSTGGILYALMLMNGIGVAENKTDGFSILYDLKTRGVESVKAMLKYFTYNSNSNSKELLIQAIKLCNAQYMGDYAFAEGAPEAYMYHKLAKDSENAVNYYVTLKDDRSRYTDEFIKDLGKNYIENFDKPEDVLIDDQPLLYPEETQILEMYNPTTGARAFMPKMILEIKASIPRLPIEYDRYNINFEEIAEKFE